MSGKQPDNQFENDVLPAEFQEIRRRRANVGDSRELPPLEGRPQAKHDLTGLAFSGGGIRSAAFSMGVVQRLISKGLFRKVDYISTVSGGGYTGSCLSALMQGEGHGERLLTDRDEGKEPPALNHVRNHSDYLTPGGVFSQLQLPALPIAGAFHTLLMMLPSIVLLVLLTELFFEVTSHLIIGAPHWLAGIGVVPLALALIFRPLVAGRGAWAVRDRAFRRLGWWLLLAVISALAIPTLKWLSSTVNNDAEWIFNDIRMFFDQHMELGARSWLLWVSAGLIIGLTAGLIKLRMRLVLLLVGLLGPVFLFSIYIISCIYVVNSPISVDENHALRTAVDRYSNHHQLSDSLPLPASQQEAVESASALHRQLDQLLSTKHLSMADYTISMTRWKKDSVLVLDRKPSEARARWLVWLTQGYSRQLHITFESRWLSEFRGSDDEHNLIVIDELKLLKGHAEWWFYIAGLLLWLYNYFFVNLNRISLHPFYRDRLSRTFLVRPDKSSGHTRLVSADDLPLSNLGGLHSTAPYHLINTALNLQGSANHQLRERKTVPFLMAQRFCGSDLTGYCQTADLEKLDPHFNLGTAMAISAAAASPNMGTVTVRPLTFLLALLNIRLNYWLPHPNTGRQNSWYHRLFFGKLGLTYLLSEALGYVNDRTPFINCSDGGHIENLAVYELIKRRCQTIICVDGEADPGFNFKGFVTLQRYVEIDFGARIDIDLHSIRPGHDGASEKHHAIGTITYDNGEQATFIYLKLSYTRDEPEYLHLYKKQVPIFPHESTADQFFDETQFEVYRALGSHVADCVFDV